MAHQPVYDDRTANVTDKPPNSAKKIGIDVGRNPVVPALVVLVHLSFYHLCNFTTVHLAQTD